MAERSEKQRCGLLEANGMQESMASRLAAAAVTQGRVRRQVTSILSLA